MHLDHLQIALPVGAEDTMRLFYCDVLGCIEVLKPAELAGRGGFWAQAGTLDLHFGVDPDFHAATKAHPAFVVRDIETLATLCEDAGYVIAWDTKLPDVVRFFVSDPVGNRIEVMASP